MNKSNGSAQKKNKSLMHVAEEEYERINTLGCKKRQTVLHDVTCIWYVDSAIAASTSLCVMHACHK